MRPLARVLPLAFAGWALAGLSGCVASGGIGSSDPFVRGGGQASAPTSFDPRSGSREPLAIDGRITSVPDDTPLARARIALESVDRGNVVEVRADSAGAFRFEPLPQGLYLLRAEREGYVSLEIQLSLEGLPPVRLEVELSRPGDEDHRSTAQLFGRQDPLQVAGFYDRRARESGTFLLAADIRRRGVGSASELVLSIPGFRLAGFTIVGRRGCSPTLFVDGLDVGDLRQIDRLVSLWSIAALEAYPGSSPPAVFAGLNSQCGAVAIWTPRGA